MKIAHISMTRGGLFDGRATEKISHLIPYGTASSPTGLGPIFCGLDRFKSEDGFSWHRTSRNPFGRMVPVCPECVDGLAQALQDEADSS